MLGQQFGMITAACLVIVACIGWIETSRGLARAIGESSWGRLGLPFRPRMMRVGLIGAGMVGIIVGVVVIVLAFTVAAK